MNETGMNNEDIMNDSPQRAVSIYGRDDGVEDFPVLKAFQQYIDAEQEKSRKRILTLGIFFGVVLILVIAVFMFLLHGINVRNQALSDRLVEYAMNESARKTVVAPAPSAGNEAALKAMTDTLVTLQKQMLETKREVPVAKPATVQSSDDRQTRLEVEKLTRAKALLDAEKQRLAVEKERLHQIEIEQQRRKLYPELYQPANTEYVPYESRRNSSRTRTLTDEDIREIIREAYPESEAKSTKSNKRNQDSDLEKDESEKDGESGAIEYFKDEEYTIPTDIKGGKSTMNLIVPLK